MSGNRAAGIDFDAFLAERIQLGWRLVVANDAAVIHRRSDRQVLPDVAIARNFAESHPRFSSSFDFINRDVVERDVIEKRPVAPATAEKVIKRCPKIKDAVFGAILGQQRPFNNRKIQEITGASATIIAMYIRQLLRSNRIEKYRWGWYRVVSK